MRILAIDPGYVASASLVYLTESRTITEARLQTNGSLLESLVGLRDQTDLLAIEMMQCFGMPVGREVLETCVWIGKFIERYHRASVYVYRKDVKMYLCRSMRATDANIRAALIDMFGPGKDAAVGTKKAPGPLYGIKRDLWSAVSVGVTAAHEGEPR